MIVGIGTDIVNIERIENLITKFGYKFLNRVFTHNEIIESQKFSSPKRSSYYLAKRFAAKEAYAKATGLGIRNKITFNQIEILNDSYGRPFIILHNNTKEQLTNAMPSNHVPRIHLSLSDEYPLAIAYVIIEAI
ncbi:Holo-[acyl-carrier-protein] synthase [Rickettsiales bacterium Ac37b]|nr:Holo-[acyl-carrier-protein] synthase [Rickettsiales bacterium Ac37b]